MSDSKPDQRVLRSRRRLAQSGVGLALALIALLVVIAPPPTAAWAAGTYSSSSESLLVQLTNQARANAGLRSLTVDATLRTEARSRSRDMIERNYFSHAIPPDGHKVFDELRAMGYCYVSAAENIGWNTYPDDTATQAIQDMFMGSSGHRANILGSAWTVMGVGAYQGSTDKKMWTVLFAQPCSGGGSTPTPKPPTPKPATPKPATPRPATPRPATPPSSDGTVDRGLRVADPPVSQGLFESIVGGVASLFFGS